MAPHSQPGFPNSSIAVVGKSSFFPAAASPKAFWPGVLGLKGLMSGLATGQWPFNAFFSEDDLKRLKGFVMKSGLAMGAIPPDGFEIPAEVFKISQVVPLLALFLGKQAIEDTKCLQNGKIKPGKVKVFMNLLSENPLVRECTAGFFRKIWTDSMLVAGVAEDKIKKTCEAAQRLISENENASVFGKDLPGKFAIHYGFEVASFCGTAPLPGTMELFSCAVKELQSKRTDLAIVGGIDYSGTLFSVIEEISNKNRSIPETYLKEGMGMLVLRRLEDLSGDSDNIYAIISAADPASIKLLSPSPEKTGFSPETKPAEILNLSYDDFMNGGETGTSKPLGGFSGHSSQKRKAFFNEKRFVVGASISDIGFDQSWLGKNELQKIDWLPNTISKLYGISGTNSELAKGVLQAEHLSHHTRLHPIDIVYDSNEKTCRNLPFNRLSVSVEVNGERIIARGGIDQSLNWKDVRECWLKKTGELRFFHDLLGALFGTFVRKVVLRKPREFDEVASRPVIYMANHQIGLESPLFMALSYAMTGIPIQAVAKPEHVNAWLAFLLAFAEDSLGDNQPFHLMYFDKQQPHVLIDALKNGERKDSLLVHVEGTRAMEAGQPVTKLSSVFLDMAIAKNVPMVPVRFVGGLPLTPTTERLDFPFGNGKQDYFIGGPIFPEDLTKMPYGQRPKFVMDQINSLGPLNDEDGPLEPNKKFEEKTKFFIESFGLPKMQAMLFSILTIIDDPCEETAILSKAVQSGKLGGSSVELPPVLKKFLSHVKTKFT